MKEAIVLCCATLLTCGVTVAQTPPPKPQIMIVGVAHLAAKADLHNATWGRDALDPVMQGQIKDVVGRLAAFKPTKVMIEALASDPNFVAHYQAYRAGSYELGENEDDQFGYRLAALMRLTTIFPIDAKAGFPFDYDAVKASAEKHGQESILLAADEHLRPLIEQSNRLEKESRLLDLLIYLNTPAALQANAAWYLYVNRIGDAHDYAGADLTSFWYARNIHILANVTRSLAPGDRVVIFIGQGHAAMLRPLVRLSPFLQDVDPESYLNLAR